MDYIDIHAHMTSRTTDDYEQMALSGCRALTEPAFWAGHDRGSAAAFAPLPALPSRHPPTATATTSRPPTPAASTTSDS